MSTSWKTVRVFISSTFRDMQAERDWLVKRVFPTLRQRLEPHRIHLVDIDLRWGITQQQSENDQVLGLCLQQIDECRPFFLGVLGGRYGWVPSSFPVDVGKSFGWTQHHTGKSVTELEIVHGVLNDPSMHGRAMFCFRDDAFLQHIVDEQQRRVYLESPTNEEVQELGRAEAERNARKRSVQLESLKEIIRAMSPPMPLFDGYPCKWNQTLLDPVSKTLGRLDGLKVFGDWVIEKLEQAIIGAPEFREHFSAISAEEKDEIGEDRDFHERFIENRTRFYIGRQQLQDELLAFATGAETKPCLLTGPSGSGKSAALAKFVSVWRAWHPQEVVISHFVGASPRSTSLREMLRRLCAELKDTLNLEDEIKQNVRELSDQFRKFLARVPPDRSILLVLDALNQLDKTDNANTLHWLPTQLPPLIRLMVSCIDDPDRQDQPALTAMRRHGAREISVNLLNDDERLGIVREIPSVAAKTLDETQVRLLLNNEATRNPLFLLVALEELRGFGSFEELNREIASLPRTGDTLTLIFQQVIRRLGKDFNAGTVKEVLTLLVCSRHGLSERELLDVLEDVDVIVEASSTDLFPILRQLRPYLQLRGPLLDFYHRHLAKATCEEFFQANDSLRLAGHQRLAEYFYGQDYFLESLEEQRARAKRLPPTPRPANNRKVNELPWQLLEASELSGEWDAVEKLFTDLLFLEAKVEAGFVIDLAGEFSQVVGTLPGERLHHRIVRLLEQALYRDIQFIARHPTTLFQCIWNTCWWFDYVDIEPCSERLSLEQPTPTVALNVSAIAKHWLQVKEVATPGILWLRLLRPFPTILDTELRMTFKHGDKNTDEFSCVCFSPDGRRIISGSRRFNYQAVVRVWDAATGEEVMCITGHDDDVTCVAFSPDGMLFASGDNTGILKLWDSMRGTELKTLSGHSSIVKDLGFSKDGKRLISCGHDGMVRVWEVTTGRQLHSRGRKNYKNNCIDVASDGCLIACGMGWSGNRCGAEVWDLRNGRAVTWLPHGEAVYAICFSDDGSKVLTGAADGQVREWHLADRTVVQQYSASDGDYVVGVAYLSMCGLKPATNVRVKTRHPEAWVSYQFV